MGLALHDRAKQALAAVRERPTGSYLFYGAESAGKATAAAELARSLNCQGTHSPKSPCRVCAQFAGGTYPDLITVAPADKPSITIEQIRRLAATLSMQPYYATGVRIVIINDSQFMTIDAANALLKLLEEPPPRTLFVLIAPTAEALLATVRSRCVAVYFPLPPRADTIALLADRHHLDQAAAANLVDAAGGAPGAALAMAADPAVAATRLELAEQAASTLTRNRFERLRLAGALAASTADIGRFGLLVHANLVAALQQQTISAPDATRGLAALEHFRRQLSAKVAPRVALERLMLEL